MAVSYWLWNNSFPTGSDYTGSTSSPGLVSAKTISGTNRIVGYSSSNIQVKVTTGIALQTVWNGAVCAYVSPVAPECFKIIRSTSNLSTTYFTSLPTSSLPAGSYHLGTAVTPTTQWYESGCDTVNVPNMTMQRSVGGAIQNVNVIAIWADQAGDVWIIYDAKFYSGGAIPNLLGGGYVTSGGGYAQDDVILKVYDHESGWSNGFNGVITIQANATVSKRFYDWITGGAIQPDTSITVYDPTGSTVVATLTGLYKIKAAATSNIGATGYLLVTDIYGTATAAHWTMEPVSGKQYVGLGNADGDVIVPIGSSVAVNWTGAKTLREIWRRVTPIDRTFDLTLYQNRAENNRVDKSGYLTSVITLSGALREECSILSPVIVVELDTVPTCNYAYVAEWNRYYFITGIRSIRKNLWELSMRVDVLMTYKAALASCDGHIVRQEEDYDPWLVDSRMATDATERIDYIEPSSVPGINDFRLRPNVANSYSYVLAGVDLSFTLGGGS